MNKFASGTAALDDRTVVAIASDGREDRVGDILVPTGCVLDEYLANPIVLANHDPTKTIGTASVRVSESAVVATITFAPKGVSPIADEWAALCKTGVLRAASVGFDAIEKEPRRNGGWLFKIWNLLELSVVAVPCNPGALIVPRGYGTKSMNIHRKSCGLIVKPSSRKLSLGERLAIVASLRVAAPPSGQRPAPAAPPPPPFHVSIAAWSAFDGRNDPLSD